MSNVTKGKEDKLAGKLWPTKQYYLQLKKLKTMINQPVYIVPLQQNRTSLSFSLRSKALILVAIIEYPLADPENHIYPHMLVFDDGTGINLGRILRISKNQAFSPEKKNIIYEDKKMQESLMYRERRLSHESIKQTSRRALGEILSIAHQGEIAQYKS